MASPFRQLISTIPENQIIEAGWVPIICVNAPPFKFIKSISPGGYDVYIDISRENQGMTSLTCEEYSPLPQVPGVPDESGTPHIEQSIINAAFMSLEGSTEAVIFERPGGFVIISRLFGQSTPNVKHYTSVKSPVVGGQYSDNGYTVVNLTSLINGKTIVEEHVELVVRRIRNVLYPDCMRKLSEFQNQLLGLVEVWNKFNSIRSYLTEEPDDKGGPVLGSLNRDIDTLAKISNKLTTKGINTDMDRLQNSRLIFTRYKRESDISFIIAICNQFDDTSRNLQGVTMEVTQFANSLQSIKDSLERLADP